jgi:hypothetical protein
MREELDKKLVESFPNLFVDRRGSHQKTSMCWGFSCGDGWFDLIWDLSEKLEKLIEEGDWEEGRRPKAFQVKEKFGSLCFYLSYGSEEMTSLCDDAERRSIEVCESCGNPGEIRKLSWVKTLCSTCHERSK